MNIENAENIDTNIKYNELCNRDIKYPENKPLDNVPGWIAQAIQNVTFSLNESGGNLISEAAIRDQSESISLVPTRNFIYNEPFVLFLKEADKEKPYFALKVDNTDVLEKIEIIE